MSEINSDGIAVIGMVGRFPGANNVEEFWANLVGGVESISVFTPEEMRADGVDISRLKPGFVQASGLIKDPEWFDPAFFGINFKEAEVMSPQHRVFLETAWQALEDAAYDPARYPGLAGVFAGMHNNSYYRHCLQNRPDVLESAGAFTAMLGNEKDYLATLVAYKMNLRGPALNIQTACSTSLVTIVQACQALLAYQCDMALAGGVTIMWPQKLGDRFPDALISSQDGHCRVFDTKGSGTVFSNGVGVVVLKRLAEALADGDQIYAVIKGSAVNNDGGAKVSFAAPGVDGHVEVISLAQALAGFPPETITYVEAHGTGTPLGDPNEISALTQAFRSGTQARQFCAIGSVKTNIGHLVVAGGVTGLIKTVLALKHKQIPPSLHFNEPNPQIDFPSSPFYVNTRLAEWKTGATPRRAGVSSFGVGGTNAHIVLEEAPAPEPSVPTRPWQLLLLSAKTATALEVATGNLAAHLKAAPSLNLADAAFTLQVGRKGFKHRRAVVCPDAIEAVTLLESREARRVWDGEAEARHRQMVFLFTSQGAQHTNMARGLYEGEPMFRAAVDDCCEILRPHLGFDLRDILYPAAGQEEAAGQRLQKTANTQPALFVIEYALAQLWMKWGVKPGAMLGHSIGEYVAACLAGVFSLPDALRLVAVRGRLMQALPPGEMLAVSLPESELAALLGENLALAAMNAPELCVVSGPHAAVEALTATLQARGVEPQRLHTSHAFHSAMMDPALEPFRAELAALTLNPPQIPFVSNLTGKWITVDQAMSPDYWVQHLRHPVRFNEGLQTLLADPDRIFLEVGPGTTLTALAKLQPGQARNPAMIASTRHVNDAQPDQAVLLQALGRLWLAGVEPDWKAFYEHERRRRVSLPTYPFERRRCWVEPGKPPAGIESLARRATEKKPNLADWFYLPAWKTTVRPDLLATTDPADPKLTWLVFVDGCGVGAALVEKLMLAGARVFQVSPGRKFAQTGESAYALDVSRPEDFKLFGRELARRGQFPNRVIHCWNVTADPPASRHESFGHAPEPGFFSLMFFMQAVAEQATTVGLQIKVVTNHTQSVTGAELLSPEKATVLALAKVIPQELQPVRCACVDVELPPKGVRLDGLIAQLWSELSAENTEPVVAWRGRQRWAQAFEAVSLAPAASEKTALRQGGVYLITGGLGGMGLALAEHLAEKWKAKLVLTGRSAIPAREAWAGWLAAHDDQNLTSGKIRRLQNIEAKGGTVLACQADSANETEMRAVILQTIARFGTLHGVVHAAGILDKETFQPIVEIRRADCDRQFRPKMEGLCVLASVLRGRDLDFCVLASSLASVLGGLGYGAYAAANQFMDTFAAQQNRSGKGRWLAVNWDEWEVNELAVADRQLGAFVARLIMKPAEGVLAFERLLALRGESQVAVSTGDLPARFARWVKLESLEEDKPSPPDQPIQTPPPSVPVSKNFLAPRNAAEESIANIWKKLLGLSSVGVRDNFFELGGHSLMAVRLMALLEAAFGQKFPLSTLYSCQTIEALAFRLHPAAEPSAPDTVKARPPLFCTPPAGGNVLVFRYLAPHLVPDQPLHGLQPSGLDGNSPVLATVEETAAHFIRELRVLQPKGPYYLASWCNGVTAFETACQLTEQGETVALLVLMETDAFFINGVNGTFSLRLRQNYLRHQERMTGLGFGEKCAYVARRAWGWIKLPFARARQKARVAGGRLFELAGQAAPNPLARATIYDADVQASRLYRVKTFPGRMVMFWANRDPDKTWFNPQLDWGSIAKGGVEHHFFETDRANFLNDPNAALVAEKLRGLIAAAQPGTGEFPKPEAPGSFAGTVK